MADLGDPSVPHVSELRERRWSARKLADAYECEGTGTLTKSGAAKVESGKRRLVADKTPEVVRVLDGTPTYPLEATGPRVFLSYAEEDRETGCEIAEWLSDSGLKVINPLQRSGGPIEIEAAINRADAFLALLSPSYLRSFRCHTERELGTRREQRLRDSEPGSAFVYVLQVHDTPDCDAGLIRNHDWGGTSLAGLDAELNQLIIRLKSSSHIEPADHVASALWSTKHDHRSPAFCDRHGELATLMHGLAIASGPHFWLVIAPPRLGKTWFLSRLSAEMEAAEPSRWITKRVDLREQPPDVRVDAGTLLAYLFGLKPPVTTEAETLRSIAHNISRNGGSYLCLLDSAELLEKETAEALRWCLSRIYNLVQTEGNVHARIALIVASRRDDKEWRGVSPAPRLTTLPLAEFKVDAVQDALRVLADQMGRTYSSSEFWQNAVLVHRLTEGLPALLGPSLQWIRAKEWRGMERLEGQKLFEDLAEPYIYKNLLVQDSLFQRSGVQPQENVRALEHAFRVLAPYRLFTQSHLRHHLGLDSGFQRALDNAKWSLQDLWIAISGTALLKRPLDEPWQEIYAAIRRLLYRYYYTSDEQRAVAHREARNFVEIWADRQSGKEQVIGLVECLWHEAEVLRLTRHREIAQALSESARKLSLALRPSAAYTLPELRAYAAQRISSDEELQESIDHFPGLTDRLTAIVAAQL
jgi:TIR domain